MFGYVQIRKPELKIKDFEVYRGFYCGLCSRLKEEYGILGELTLTYDMTFLILLLSSVYELPVKRKKERCLAHPAKKHLKLWNECTDYAAHLNIILSYHHFLDDIEDEHSKKARVGSTLYYPAYKKAVKRYPGKAGQIEKCLKRLSVLEKRGAGLRELADVFGKLMMVLFSYRDDAFLDYFRKLGYHLGCFIYIMDAYDDLSEDRKKGCFNPLLKEAEKKGFERRVKEMLLGEISEAAAVYQKLPCLSYQDILGNIIYAGVWNRFDQLKMRKEKGTGGKKSERSL